ncbi:alginate lyase family protein [Marinobacter xestospongiae]|uniref:alginate lyase family protein n=1 Tax=Marinobacter xestospongiae TaxID=994319 RepID=UPI0020041353|nr:alginate lyase family protein [Marinobacter xestospongiae]MCK7568472.1 alginate lyase family protein [Marinobacter xestospongiae]
MSLNRTLNALLLTSLWVLPQAPAQAVPAGVPTQPVSADCPREVVVPYTGHLQLPSKYDQSDASKSTLRTELAAEPEAIKAQIQAYSKQVVGFADYYLSHTGDRHRRGALACLHGALGSWADAGALLSTDASKTGVAVRKWSLAAIATAAWKLQRLSTDAQPFRLTGPERAWLAALATQVEREYAPRLDPDFRYFNNHDYWAGWALVVTAMALEQPAFGELGYRIFDRALSQIEQDDSGQLGWLPNEVARAHLATNYLNYALNPLALLARHAAANGHAMSADQRQRLRSLVRFVVAAELSPTRLPPVLAQEQEPVPDYKFAWLLPLLDLDPRPSVAWTLYQRKAGNVDGYSQAGGRLAPLYPAASLGPQP